MDAFRSQSVNAAARTTSACTVDRLATLLSTARPFKLAAPLLILLFISPPAPLQRPLQIRREKTKPLVKTRGGLFFNTSSYGILFKLGSSA